MLPGQKNHIAADVEAITLQVDFHRLQHRTILLTGASGLLGVWFLYCLAEAQREVEGISVIAVTRSGFREAGLEERLANLSVYTGDLTDPDFCRSLPVADYIIHAAGYGQPAKFMEQPVATLRLNTFTTFLLFDRLKPGGSFLFLSSSEVYTGLSGTNFREDQSGAANPTHPRSCYIEGKRGGEAICMAYRNAGVRASAVRLAHTYGPGAGTGDHRVLFQFIEKAMQGQIDLVDTGSDIRTYCYAADAVRLMWKMLFSASAPVYNLCGNSEVSVAGLAKLIGEIMSAGVSVPPEGKGVAGAPRSVTLDMTLVHNEFGRQTYTGIREGLERTIAWYLGRAGSLS
jgi:nucleoside-diphosphate-sugar epimerase